MAKSSWSNFGFIRDLVTGYRFAIVPEELGVKGAGVVVTAHRHVDVGVFELQGPSIIKSMKSIL